MIQDFYDEISKQADIIDDACGVKRRDTFEASIKIASKNLTGMPIKVSCPVINSALQNEDFRGLLEQVEPKLAERIFG